MPDINKESFDFWKSIKPMIDEEIKAQTRGMVQRRKAKVTTAPSLNTNVIGVTEPFGSEMFIPFTTNLISATVGDVVWVEFMYGATNAFASMYASADEKDWDVAGDLSVVGNVGIGGNLGVSGSSTFQDATVNGVLDITPRRCQAASLPSAGWYRAVSYNAGAYGNGEFAFVVTLKITRAISSGNEAHEIKLLASSNRLVFADEISSGSAANISRIRYTYNQSTGYAYIDIRAVGALNNVVTVDFDVSTVLTRKNRFTAASLEAVADSPSGETVLTEYSFAANTMQQSVTIPYSQIASSNGTIWGSESHVRLVWDNEKVIMTGYILLQNPESRILNVSFNTPSGFPYAKFSSNWLIVGQAYRRNGAYMEPCDFAYATISSSVIRILERNMFSGHPATDYAMITIPSAVYYF